MNDDDEDSNAVAFLLVGALALVLTLAWAVWLVCMAWSLIAV